MYCRPNVTRRTALSPQVTTRIAREDFRDANIYAVEWGPLFVLLHHPQASGAAAAAAAPFSSQTDTPSRTPPKTPIVTSTSVQHGPVRSAPAQALNSQDMVPLVFRMTSRIYKIFCMCTYALLFLTVSCVRYAVAQTARRLHARAALFRAIFLILKLFAGYFKCLQHI